MKPFTAWEAARLSAAYTRQYRTISRFPNLSPDEQSAYQLARIQRLVRLAYEQTSFYRKLYANADAHPNDIRSWEDFELLPSITKEQVIAHRNACVVRDRREEPNVRITRSSGSSGHVLNIVTDSEFWIQTALQMLRMFKGSFTVTPRMRTAWIYTSVYPYQSVAGMYRVNYIKSLTPVERMITRLHRLRPQFLTGYPSILLELLDKFPDECRRLAPQVISTNSEQATAAQRQVIAEGFGAPVFDEYSTEEMSLGGFQCTHQRYHLQERCAYFEILDMERDTPVPAGALGEITGTCLINEMMPLIRYRQGDLGAITGSNCGCPERGRLLSDISGRRNSSFLLPNGEAIPSGRILDWAYSLVLDLRAPIAQFEVVQRSADQVDVSVIATKRHKRVDEDALRRSFLSTFGDIVDVRVKQVDHIPRTAIGKHIPIRSELR